MIATALAVQVWPSRGASSAAWVPIEPEAPGWLTTTMVASSASSRRGATTRVIWSVEPPADQGTMMLMGCSGCQPWSCAHAAPTLSPNAAAAIVVLMAFPPPAPPPRRAVCNGLTK